MKEIFQIFNTYTHTHILHHKNVEYFSVECDDMHAFPFSFKNLKRLNFCGNIQENDTICKYIGSMKHLKTIKLNSSFNKWDSDLFDKLLLDILLNLEKIQFGVNDENCEKRSIETISYFMKQSQNLQKKLVLFCFIKMTFRVYIIQTMKLKCFCFLFRLKFYLSDFFKNKT